MSRSIRVNQAFFRILSVLQEATRTVLVTIFLTLVASGGRVFASPPSESLGLKPLALGGKAHVGTKPTVVLMGTGDLGFDCGEGA